MRYMRSSRRNQRPVSHADTAYVGIERHRERYAVGVRRRTAGPIDRYDPGERVVDNIVRNAETHGEGLRSVIVRRTLDQALIHFDDGGPGIDAGLAERIFEPFVRGDQADPTSGAGLGMAIVTEHAARIDARVSIGASPLGGARVSIALSLAGSP